MNGRRYYIVRIEPVTLEEAGREKMLALLTETETGPVFQLNASPSMLAREYHDRASRRRTELSFEPPVDIISNDLSGDLTHYRLSRLNSAEIIEVETRLARESSKG